MPEKKTKQEKTVMYVGPAIAGVVAYGTVFKWTSGAAAAGCKGRTGIEPDADRNRGSV